jgi:hypothetical protein
MLDDDRLTRLRALIDRLERLPVSAESEWMLREARARMVDVETGERPAGLRPLASPAEGGPEPVVRRRAETAVKREKPSRPEPAPREWRVRPAEPSDAPLPADELLSLDDGAPAEPDDDGSHPWRRGLRG